MPFVLTEWLGENNWLVPPVSLVPRVIRHLFVCRSMGTLIAPKWVSAPFWAMLFGPHSSFSVFVKETIVFTDVSNIFVPGSTECIFDGPNLVSCISRPFVGLLDLCF